MDFLTSFNPHLILGACEIGVLISYALFGVTTVQAYIYYGRFPNDSSKLKALVTFVWVCLLAQVVSAGHAIYTVTISDFGQFFRLLGPAPKSLGVTAFFGGIIGVSVQGFFSYRIYAFTKKLYIPMISWCMAFVRLLGITAYFVAELQMTSVPVYVEQWGWLLTTVWCVTAANDFTITATLVANLISHRSHIHKRTVPLVDKLVMWTIATGMLTSIMAIVVMICFVTMKYNFIWLGVYLVVPGLYSNSFLASLNSREKLRAMNDSLLISTLNFAAGLSSGPKSSVG
ncbi:hypothetical protein DFH08DRAFT_878289 [Mycena albidolilacea]|uniref:DUF6534 domain-containing protein n=1 Tax=Mycena albidolilacea TaxID=1033008 RepID=A0AAD6ZRK0_9AGAR|nr:hypothetical protein DFH08DRAFT_878289 [Mycena albidolilacea]